MCCLNHISEYSSQLLSSYIYVYIIIKLVWSTFGSV